ncbi:MAG: hypothetical protein V4623_05260 [Pseudomonadota bacterium]
MSRKKRNAFELAVQRAQLSERIAAQRATLISELAPVIYLLRASDHALVGLRQCTDALKKHPSIPAAGLVFLLFWQARRLRTVLRYGGSLWRVYRRACALWSRLKNPGLR